MKTTLENRVLPPCGRDFEAYRMVRMHELSTREVAEALHISQTRVCQIVKKVFAFLKDVVPDEEHAPKENARLRIAEMIASERMSNLYGQAMRCFDASQGKVTVERVKIGDRTLTTKTSFGDSKYLNAAERYTLAGAKLPARSLDEYWDFDEAEWDQLQAEGAEKQLELERQERELERQEYELERALEQAQQEQRDEEDPPVEACSVEAAELEVAPQPAERMVVAKSLADVAYEQVSADLSLPKSLRTSPVHSAASPSNGRPKPLDPKRRAARQAFLSQAK